jgi:hypothetical protein
LTEIDDNYCYYVIQIIAGFAITLYYHASGRTTIPPSPFYFINDDFPLYTHRMFARSIDVAHRVLLFVQRASFWYWLGGVYVMWLYCYYYGMHHSWVGGVPHHQPLAPDNEFLVDSSALVFAIFRFIRLSNV